MLFDRGREERQIAGERGGVGQPHLANAAGPAGRGDRAADPDQIAGVIEVFAQIPSAFQTAFAAETLVAVLHIGGIADLARLAIADRVDAERHLALDDRIDGGLDLGLDLRFVHRLARLARHQQHPERFGTRQAADVGRQNAVAAEFHATLQTIQAPVF